MARRIPDLAVVYDRAERSPLRTLWALGMAVNRTRHDIAARSWADAYAKLRELSLQRPIRELHVWGHGAPARPLIDGRSVNLDALAAALPDLELVWWRSCSVHRGVRGKEFAIQAVRTLHATSVGHCQVISSPNFLRQRGICAYTKAQLLSGKAPWWDNEGRGLPGVSTLRMTVPRKAYLNSSP